MLASCSIEPPSMPARHACSNRPGSEPWPIVDSPRAQRAAERSEQGSGAPSGFAGGAARGRSPLADTSFGGSRRAKRGHERIRSGNPRDRGGLARLSGMLNCAPSAYRPLMRDQSGHLAVVALLGIALGIDPAPAAAAPCAQTVTKASAKFVQTAAKAMQRCHDARMRGQLAADTNCATDSATVARIGVYRTKLASQIDKACGGSDGACGTGDDPSLASYGWGAVGSCPSLDGSACSMAIADCDDVSACVACLDEHAVRQTMGLASGSANASAFGSGSAVNRCQRAIGKATAKYVGSAAKALSKCWDARLRAQHANACPAPGDGRAAAVLARAEQKKVAAICKSCGGADRLCNGAGDFTTADIGFP